MSDPTDLQRRAIFTHPRRGKPPPNPPSRFPNDRQRKRQATAAPRRQAPHPNPPSGHHRRLVLGPAVLGKDLVARRCAGNGHQTARAAVPAATGSVPDDDDDDYAAARDGPSIHAGGDFCTEGHSRGSVCPLWRDEHRASWCYWRRRRWGRITVRTGRWRGRKRGYSSRSLRRDIMK